MSGALRRGAVFTGLLLVGVMLGSGSAASWRSGDQVSVAAGETIADDLYLSGSVVRVDGTVQGDLIVAGRDVSVGGTVEGNLWAVGGNVTLTGKVGRSARLAGSQLRVEAGANIAQDLLSAGAGLNVAPGARIGRDVAFGGGQARLDSPVARNVYIGANAAQLGSTVGGNATLALDNRATWPQNWAPGTALPDPLPGGLTLTGAARVAGDLMLRMPDRPTVPAGVVAGRVDYAAIAAPASPVNVTAPALRRAPSPWLGPAQTFVTAALSGLLLLWLARRPLLTLTERVRRAPGASAGYGLLAFVTLPILVMAVATALGLGGVLLTVLGLGGLGLPLALIGAPVLLGVGAFLAWLLGFGAQGLAAYLLGRWSLGALQPGQAAPPVPAVLLGALILAVIAVVPVLGGLVGLLALLLTLGALWLWWRPPQPAADLRPLPPTGA